MLHKPQERLAHNVTARVRLVQDRDNVSVDTAMVADVQGFTGIGVVLCRNQEMLIVSA